MKIDPLLMTFLLHHHQRTSTGVAGQVAPMGAVMVDMHTTTGDLPPLMEDVTLE